MMMMSLRLSAAPDSTRGLAVGAMERVVDSVGVAADSAVAAVSAALVVSVEAVVVSAAAMVGEEAEAVAVGVPEEDLAVVSAAAAVVTGEAEDLEGVIKCRTDLFLSVDCIVLYGFGFSLLMSVFYNLPVFSLFFLMHLSNTFIMKVHCVDYS